MTTDSITAALVVSSSVSALIVLGFYVWYAVALSRLFPKLGDAGWKGWVPVLNEIVLLQRGGVPGWSVVFYVLPIVQLYGIYLRVLAVHHIGEKFGKGAGTTVLGVLLPPVWASVLAASRMPAPADYDRRVAQLITPSDEPAAGYAAQPPAPRSAPVAQAFPTMAPSLPPQPVAPLFVPEPPPVTAAAAVPVPAPAPSVPVTPPPAVPVTPPAASVITPPPLLVVPPVVVDDDEDRTIVVEHTPFVPWRLVTDEGHVIPLRARRVLLGRKPVASSDDVAVVAVPDTTKTLSKSHARLELSADGQWTIIDLDSTNGVIIVERDGSENLLPPGGSALVPGRFLLGKVGMQVTSDDLEATR